MQLLYMQARYYDPVIGRFYLNDPVDIIGHVERGNPIRGLWQYIYATTIPTSILILVMEI
ncbi:MAG: hypothetical protein CL579_18315 [Alteromonadaceae bacterium]|nr:hypothetical protein [Alteromonadaceae bacterium]